MTAVASRSLPTSGRSPHTIAHRIASIDIIGTTKYPASLLFLMTLGPTILAIPLLERARGPIANVLTVFGRVPRRLLPSTNFGGD